ncbi:hypothetical protein D3C76_1618360 [compost metagenome]
MGKSKIEVKTMVTSVITFNKSTVDDTVLTSIKKLGVLIKEKANDEIVIISSLADSRSVLSLLGDTF